MRSSTKILWLCICIGVTSYIIAPLFLSSQHPLVQPLAYINSNVAKESIIDNITKAVQTVEYAFNPSAKCHAPFHYAVGAIDPRFDISAEMVRKDLLKAESIWEDSAKEDVLQFDSTADFKINFVFDERQQRTLASKQLGQQLDTVQAMQKGISKDYDALSGQYDKKKSQYESDTKKYKQLVDDYEKKVEYWNERGGAPEDEYQKLQQTRAGLDTMANDIEKKRKSLNTLVAQLNGLAKKEKKVVESYNKDVKTYESVYGGEKEFDQGVYTGKEINIYQFGENSELVLALAHEFGHALGMNHTENPKSIMYYLMAKQDMQHTVPSAEDMQALQGRCSR